MKEKGKIITGISAPDSEKIGRWFEFWWMAVLASPDGISFLHSTFYDLLFHPSFNAPLVLQPSTWLLSPLLSTDTTQTAYSIPSLQSPLFPPPSAFSSIFNVKMLVFWLPSSQQLVSFHVLLSSNLVLLIMFMMWGSGGTGSVTVPPLFPMLKYSSQIIYALDNICLTFSLSLLLAVCPHHTSEFLLLKGHTFLTFVIILSYYSSVWWYAWSGDVWCLWSSAYMWCWCHRLWCHTE